MSTADVCRLTVSARTLRLYDLVAETRASPRKEKRHPPLRLYGLDPEAVTEACGGTLS